VESLRASTYEFGAACGFRVRLRDQNIYKNKKRCVNVRDGRFLSVERAILSSKVSFAPASSSFGRI
jgi:hypothetical protein